MRIILASLTLFLALALLPSYGSADLLPQKTKATKPPLHTVKKPAKG